MELPARLRRLIKRPPRVHVLRLYGAIGVPGRGPSLSDDGLAGSIEGAFKRKPAAVALAVNSPGGSPVQSALIAARIRRLAADKNVPVIAFCEDVAASGGYWLACAADEIFADAASILGSIGVIYAGFGFDQIIARNGIDRRVHTAGESKMMLDPFQPEKPEDVARLKALQEDIHQVFIDEVKTRRGDRLNAEETLFDGSIRVGARAQEAGLIDGLAHLVPEMKKRFGDEVEFRDFGPRRSVLQRLGFASMAEDALGAAETRLAWSRFGL
ncbi:MAG: S49 family peptidase [Pseudomonadota bacterium]